MLVFSFTLCTWAEYLSALGCGFLLDLFKSLLASVIRELLPNSAYQLGWPLVSREGNNQRFGVILFMLTGDMC